MPKILLLEDDTDLCETVCEYFEGLGYVVEKVYDGLVAKEYLYEKQYDLLILDVNVPSLPGFELLKKVRYKGVHTPALFLTTRHQLEDLQQGYESGGDEYITKPFLLEALRVRVEYLLKKPFFHTPASEVNITKACTFDTKTKILSKDGERVHLQAKEQTLLELFLQNSGRVLSHEEVQNTLWDYDETFSESALRTYIKNLRKYIGKEKIVSHKRIGYQYIA